MWRRPKQYAHDCIADVGRGVAQRSRGTRLDVRVEFNGIESNEATRLEPPGMLSCWLGRSPNDSDAGNNSCSEVGR